MSKSTSLGEVAVQSLRTEMPSLKTHCASMMDSGYINVYSSPCHGGEFHAISGLKRSQLSVLSGLRECLWSYCLNAGSQHCAFSTWMYDWFSLEVHSRISAVRLCWDGWRGILWSQKLLFWHSFFEEGTQKWNNAHCKDFKTQ